MRKCLIPFVGFILWGCNGLYATNTSALETLDSSKVMICAIIKNEQLYVDEWLEYHQYLGVDRVQLYDNADNASTYIAGLPEKYGSFVEVAHFPGLGRQTEAYKNCTEKNKDKNMWGAFMDVDEFIVLRKHPNIKAFLQDVAPKGGSVALVWSIMGSNNATTRLPGPVVTRFIMTSSRPTILSKTIAYLNHVKQPVIHNVVMQPGYPSVDQYGNAIDCRSPYVYNSLRDTAYINHYYTKSLEEFILKRKRGWASAHHRNHLVTGEGHDARMRIMVDYDKHNNHSNILVDTTARDFYLRHHLGAAYNVTVGK